MGMHMCQGPPDYMAGQACRPGAAHARAYTHVHVLMEVSTRVQRATLIESGAGSSRLGGQRGPHTTEECSPAAPWALSRSLAGHTRR